MSSPAELLSDLSARGIRVRRDGETLWLRPRAALSQRLLAEVRSQKPELLELLRLRCARCVAFEGRGVRVLACPCGYVRERRAG